MVSNKYEDFKAYLKNKNVLITTHESVDLDGFVSCYILKIFLINYFKNEVTLFFPEFNKSTKEYLGKVSQKFSDLSFSFNEEFDILNIDLIFILDTNNLAQVSIFDKLNLNIAHIPFIFIDHHLNLKKDYKNNLSSLNIINDEVSSTSEIIYDICEFFNFKLELPYKFLLISAILTDSGFFKYGNNDTIMRVSRLLNEKVDLQEIISMLEFEQEISEKIARIKALQRLRLIRLKDWLIGMTHVSSFEAAVASLLINIGLDVSIVYSEKKRTFRISTRAKKSVCLKTGLHLGKILEEVAEEYEESGGGHDGAASLNGEHDLKKVLNKIIEKIKQILN
ncbi:MAG: bifunctional oligoribonuclease/PAP phosphatase NrnA [Promethearchaeota archaeon]